MSSATFSEHWHRVAGRRISLRPSVQTRKQIYRGETWHLILDPLNNQFFRVTPAAHEFLCRLHRGATVEEVWTESLERHPETAPGQEEVIQLLSQLHQANLLRGDLPPDSAKLSERQRKRLRRELRGFFNPMFVRFPLFDPDRLVQRAMPLVRWLFGPFGIALWLVTIAAAVKTVVEHADDLSRQSDAVLAPENLPLLYAGLLFVKLAHEFGHAFACRYFGGEVHQMGVSFMYFSPVPYVDATSSWAFRSKWERIFVGAAGMVSELFVAACAVFIWAATGDGAIHSLAYNIMWLASVTTLLFNANPLLRYDGYYILSDLLEIPNLQTRSVEMLQYVSERWLLGCRNLHSPAHSTSEGLTLSIYGVASWLYRIVVFSGIALFIADRYLLLGVIMALGCVYSFTLQPLWKLGRYLVKSPRLNRNRHRAIGIVCGGGALLLALLAWWPCASSFRAPGVLRAEEYSELFTATPGSVAEVMTPSSSHVEQGQPLVRLVSRELELALAAALADLARATAEEERAMTNGAANLEPIQSRRALAERRIRRLEDEQRGLLITAPHAGTWVSPHIADSVGQWFPRGQRIGQLVQNAQYRFSAVISQDDAANLFNQNAGSAQVRITGQAGTALAVREMKVLPAQQEILPSAALGWAAGGEVATSRRDPSGARAAEPFFELRAQVVGAPEVRLLHGRSGAIRVNLHREPLLTQGYRKLRQLLQKRFQF